MTKSKKKKLKLAKLKIDLSTDMLDCSRRFPDIYIENAHKLTNSLQPPINYVLSDLSKDIWDTANDQKQTLPDLLLKLNVWKTYSICCQASPDLESYGLFLGGSTLNGFALRTSDVDLTFVKQAKAEMRRNPKVSAKTLTTFMNNTFLSNPTVSQCQMRRTCDKHFIYFKELISNNDVNILLDSTILLNTHLMYHYTQVDWRVQPLGIIINLFAKNQELCNTYHSSINSYHLMTLLIHYLQVGVTPAVLPCLHKIAPDLVLSREVHKLNYFEPYTFEFTSSNQQTLEELLVGFFSYYSTFNFENMVISIRLGKSYTQQAYFNIVGHEIQKPSYKNSCMSLEEPYDKRNCARHLNAVHSLKKVRFAIQKAHQKLTETRDIKFIFKKF